MDLQLLSQGLDFSKKTKKWVFLLALFGASSYGAYKVYNLPSLTTKRKTLLRVFFSVVELVSNSAETIELVSRDLKEFLTSSSDEIPNSFKQVSKISRSDEFSDSLKTISEALTVGILRGYSSEAQNQGEVGGDFSLADRFMDRVLTNAGTGFISVVGSFARNLILGIRSSVESNDSPDGNRMTANLLVDGVDSSGMSSWVNVVCTDKSKELIAKCIQVFVSTAVGVYLDKTSDINFYDDIFAGLTNPNHESKMRDILVSVCNGAVETLVNTSHQVLTSNKNTNSNPSSSSSCQAANGSKDVEYSNMNGFKFGDESRVVSDSSGGKMSDKVESGSWGSMVLSTLSVPSNRRFVLDVTGRVTFETFRSLAEFSLWKLSDRLKSSGNAVKDKGRQVVTYFGLKSYVLVTIYLALYLHIICGTRALLPA